MSDLICPGAKEDFFPPIVEMLFSCIRSTNVSFPSRNSDVFPYLFHFGDVTDEGGIVDKVIELLQLAQVLDVVLPDHLHTHSSTRQTFELGRRARGCSSDVVLRSAPRR